MTRNPNVSIEDLSEVISLDPGLASRCVGVASSASPFMADAADMPDSFLPACVSVADAPANIGQINLGGEKELDQPFDTLPEWVYLRSFEMVYGLELDLAAEIAEAADDLNAFQ